MQIDNTIQIDDALNTLLLWAKEKKDSGQEPPWAWFHYTKLIETIEIIQSSRQAVILEDSPQLVLHLDSEPPKGENICSLESARLRRDGYSVQLPM